MTVNDVTACGRGLVSLQIENENILVNIRRRTYNKITESQTSFSVHFLLSLVTKQRSGKYRCLLGVCITLTIAPFHLFNPQFSLQSSTSFLLFSLSIHLSLYFCNPLHLLWVNMKQKTMKEKKEREGYLGSMLMEFSHLGLN